MFGVVVCTGYRKFGSQRLVVRVIARCRPVASWGEGGGGVFCMSMQPGAYGLLMLLMQPMRVYETQWRSQARAWLVSQASLCGERLVRETRPYPLWPYLYKARPRQSEWKLTCNCRAPCQCVNANREHQSNESEDSHDQ